MEPTVSEDVRDCGAPCIVIGSKLADPLHPWVDQTITLPWLESLLPADGLNRVCTSNRARELRKRIAQENCARELRIKKALGKHGSQGGKDTAFDRERLEASVASHPCEITRAFGSASNLFRKLCIRARLSQTTRLPKEVVKVTTVDCGSSSAMHRQPRHRCREVMAF